MEGVTNSAMDWMMDKALEEITARLPSAETVGEFFVVWLLLGVMAFAVFQLCKKAYRAAAHRRTVRYLIKQEPPDFEELARITKEWRTKGAGGGK